MSSMTFGVLSKGQTSSILFRARSRHVEVCAFWRQNSLTNGCLQFLTKRRKSCHKSMCNNLQKSSFTCLFATTPCGEIFRFWTGRHARSHLRTKFGRRRVPRLAIFSRTIARLSPLGETRKGTSLPICVFKAISGWDVYVAESAVCCAHIGS